MASTPFVQVELDLTASPINPLSVRAGFVKQMFKQPVVHPELCHPDPHPTYLLVHQSWQYLRPEISQSVNCVLSPLSVVVVSYYTGTWIELQEIIYTFL